MKFSCLYNIATDNQYFPGVSNHTQGKCTLYVMDHARYKTWLSTPEGCTKHCHEIIRCWSHT